MDVVEVLIIDHISIRLLAKCNPYIKSVDEFVSFHDFIVNCHAKIEDDIVFPALKNLYKGKYEEFVKLIEWISNDHKLLDTLGNKVIEYGRAGRQENYRERLSLYFKILLEHNTREESQLFPNWFKEIANTTRTSCTKRARKIIENYGLEKYTKLTGFSSEAYKII
jgi:hemerythrin superfamily protein